MKHLIQQNIKLVSLFFWMSLSLIDLILSVIWSSTIAHEMAVKAKRPFGAHQVKIGHQVCADSAASCQPAFPLTRSSLHCPLKESPYAFSGGNSFKMFCIPSEKRFTHNGKKLLPLGTNSLLLGLHAQESKTESHKYLSGHSSYLELGKPDIFALYKTGTMLVIMVSRGIIKDEYLVIIMR